MTTSDHPVDEVPVGALGGFPPPPPVEDDPPGDATAATGTNTMAVLGLVFAFLLPVLGVVFSAVGLIQTRRRGQDGRGLAVAGLAVSVVLLVVAAVLLATVGTTALRTAASPQDAVPAPAAGTDAPPVPAGNPADEAVVAACSTILPAVAQLQTDLGGATTVDDVASRIAALQRRIDAAAAGTGDGGFTAHAGALAADFGRLADAARAGGDPAALVGSIQQDGMTLGQDCGQAGWLP